MINLIPSKKISFSLATILLCSFGLKSQSVTEIITDYGGYWKTAANAVNPVKPDNNHNLLSFSYNGTRYSTGVDDAKLTSNGQVFTPADFRALPFQAINGTVNSNTKIGLGAMADGVASGTTAPAPSRSIAPYLADGIKGLNIGSCVANLPAGVMLLSASNIRPESIGDGVPDILVTQVADPSNTYDRYEFTDIYGNRVGNYMDIVLTNIAPVGNWMADFFETTGSTVLTSGFTQTSRAVRLWAADFSSFGINAGNIGSIAYFKIGLSGESDIAFVAYNNNSLSVNQILAIQPATRPAATNEVVKKTATVFPNPASNFVNITHPAASGQEKIYVYNMQGVFMMQKPVSAGSIQTRLDIPMLAKGSYQLAMINGKEKLSQLLLVQ